MHKSKSLVLWIPVLAFFAFYLAWLFRAYYDVAYMDTVNIIAGNMNNMLKHDTTIQDYYYRSPFLLCFSLVLMFLNCKFFDYNSYYENIASGIILLMIAVYYIRSALHLFSTYTKWIFAILSALIIFCFSKWEMSLWGGGYSHYLVVFAGIVCVNIAHKFYLETNTGSKKNKAFLLTFVILSLAATLEATSYFLPFQLALLVIMIVNLILFRNSINLRRWCVVMAALILLLSFSFFINSLAESYSERHPYEHYGKVNVSQNIGQSVKKVFDEPGFVTRFFLIANAGGLYDKDSYEDGSTAKKAAPYIGSVVLLLYIIVIYFFVKRRMFEGINAITFILSTLIFYIIVTIGRMHFGDVYYGGSSRYAAASFTGILGVATFFLLILKSSRNIGRYKKLLYAMPLVFIVICSIIVNKNQWHIAPYRKIYYQKMAENLRANEDLGLLMGYSEEITAKAREVMIRNQLNVFKPETRLEGFRVGSDLAGFKVSGFSESNKDTTGNFKHINDEAIIFLPNLYTQKDSFWITLHGTNIGDFIPQIVLNDGVSPLEIRQGKDGYEYKFALTKQQVLFRLSIRNQGNTPVENEIKTDNAWKSGIIFNGLSFRD